MKFLFKKGHKHSEKTKLKISLSSLGKKKTIEHIAKMSNAKKGKSLKHPGQFKKGQIPYNKGIPMSEEQKIKLSIAKKGQKYPFRKSSPLTEEHKKNIGKANKGKKFPNRKRKPCSEETKKKISLSNLGKRVSEKTKRKLSLIFRGSNSKLWKGGITPENERARRSPEYKYWVRNVLIKDEKMCQKCGDDRYHVLMSHHIQNFSSHKELRYEISNGITFCRKCHKIFHKLFTTRNNTMKQINTFLQI